MMAERLDSRQSATTLRPTGEQQAAIHVRDKNLIVVAGAGSGKTRVLVERYLQMLENNPDWRLKSLVAITFTREAAHEMRHRLRLELEERADRQPDGPWTRHLAEMDSARIDTIHGLCATVLRANAAPSGIDPLFDVLDEVEAAINLERIVDDVIDALDPALLSLFAEYEAYQIKQTLNRMDLVNAVLPESIPEPEELMERWSGAWSDALVFARDQLLKSEPVANLRANLVGLPGDALGELYRTHSTYLDRVAAECDAERIRQLLIDWHRDGVVGNKGSQAVWGGKEAKKAAADILRATRDQVGVIRDQIGEAPGELDQRSAELLPLWLRLLAHVQRAWRRYKHDNALLDFDDLERLAAMVLQHESVQARYRGAEFKHLLVDEFQDTNRAQWRVITALADLHSGGALFVVGDPKQSIYQFRGADVSVFNRVRRQISALDSGQELPLSTSFRSHRRLVQQFNALFARILKPEAGSLVPDYEVSYDGEMRAFREESPASVPIELLLLDSQMPDDDQSGKVKRYPAEDMRGWEAVELARRIQGMITSGREVFDRNHGGFRGIKYGDIAILFQSMSKVSIYEEIFKEKEVPFLTVAGRGYYDRQEVWDMLDLLRCLHNPLDDLSLASILRSPMFGFSDDLLFALRLITDESSDERGPVPLWQALQIALADSVPGIFSDDLPLIQFAVKTLSDLRANAGRVGISNLLRRALRLTGYLAIVTGLPDGDRRRGNIEKLLQLADDSGMTTLGHFSRYLLDLTSRELREGEATLEPGNAVRMMTVHASKGLEFPLVILADASWERGWGAAPIVLNDPEIGFSCQVFDVDANKYAGGFAHRQSNIIQMQKEAAERKRLLYVAATRAQDYLLISGQVRRNSKGICSAKGWLKLLLPAFELSKIESRIEQMQPFAGDEICVSMPTKPAQSASVFSRVDEKAFEAADADPQYAVVSISLPMLDPIPSDRAGEQRHLSATQIADLGAYYHSRGHERDLYRRRWLESTRYDAPSHLTSVSQPRRGFSARALGAIVHELLRYSMTEPTAEMIASLAWQQGVTSEAQIKTVVARVYDILAAYERSEIYSWIESARSQGRPILTELPFIYNRRPLVIHGVVDMLLQTADESWSIIDYKITSTASDIVAFSRRYRLQLGIYAVALQERLGLPNLPTMVLHFLPGNHTMRIAEADCLAELSQLESIIGDVETPAKSTSAQ